MPPIIYRYIAKEILGPFWIALFVFTGILFLTRSLQLVELVVNKSVPAGDIILLFSYIVPRFLELAMPMSLLLAVLTAFGRLSADSELVVIRATGVSLKQLAQPVFFVALLVTLVSLILSLWITPYANYRLGLGMFEIARTQASAGLVSGAFNEVGQLTIYAETIDNTTQRLQNVIINDRTNPAQSRTFIANHGKIISDKRRRSLSLQLYSGSIQEGSDLDSTITYFDVNTISLPHSQLIEGSPTKDGKRSKEMFLGELLGSIQSAAAENDGTNRELAKTEARYWVEFHRRFAIPVSCLAVALIAMALGIQPSRGGKTWGGSMSVAIGISVIVLYYGLFAIGNSLAEQARAPAVLLIWTPNVLFLAIGMFLFQRMGSEQWLAVTEAIGEGFLKVQSYVRRFSQWLAGGLPSGGNETSAR